MGCNACGTDAESGENTGTGESDLSQVTNSLGHLPSNCADFNGLKSVELDENAAR